MALLTKKKGRSIDSFAELVGRLRGMSDAQIDVFERELSTPIGTLDAWQMSGMTEACEAFTRFNRYWPERGRDVEMKRAYRAHTQRMAIGDEASTANTLADAELLVDAIIQHDPRLARRARWHRGEEGELACPALLAAGDDAPYFFRRRGNVSEAAGGEPIRFVISTDANEITPGTAAAFIAAVKILQQWRSVEVWWQGSWLSSSRTRGWVFLVPLVQGDMDFTRLDFCLSSPRRDTVSYGMMIARTMEHTHRLWNGCNHTADRSYLPGESHFIQHKGMTTRVDHLAIYCAYWLGFADYSPDAETYRLVASAEQSLPEITRSSAPLTEAERARIKRESDEAERLRRETEAEAARRRERAIFN